MNIPKGIAILFWLCHVTKEQIYTSPYAESELVTRIPDSCGRRNGGPQCHLPMQIKQQLLFVMV